MDEGRANKRNTAAQSVHAKPVRSESLMLSPTEELSRCGKQVDSFIYGSMYEQLAHPSAKKIRQQIDSFIDWLVKKWYNHSILRPCHNSLW